ncbi:hypothetical protein C7B65_13570 [Phormidesmis priestleyi ULC007]|uniref:DUF4276 domain-containing protein n=1 Tax=Phormidesmis priestleyi ULC007 TaxID=1920490 RepID=A0A2T1DED7_9CYAN|nr:hypothetical protein [Phormidesmis priestleyi]PSB18801.1 hypothetical protein C7B65_13570 [Phormidesmis priestleyi ULC007]PZO51060.1 MAG: hypothetical protein DCF14_10245 [Phormidesmis priestleyi]
MTDIPINLAVEDDLSEAVLKEILKQSKRPFSVGTCLKRQGYGYLKKNLPGINKAAKGLPYLVLTDLDKAECPLALISEWLSQPKHPNLIFRVAVTEVEAWLLAHREAYAKFLGISVSLIPDNVDAVPDPKQLLIDLTRRSRKRTLRDAIVPAPKSSAKIGRDYNGQLIQFVQQNWKVELAKTHSPSLERAVNAIVNFEPIWKT